jgi:hypothetical protein
MHSARTDSDNSLRFNGCPVAAWEMVEFGVELAADAWTGVMAVERDLELWRLDEQPARMNNKAAIISRPKSLALTSV